MDKVVTEMGKRIARRRKELGLTQDEVAEQAGLTPQQCPARNVEQRLFGRRIS